MKNHFLALCAGLLPLGAGYALHTLMLALPSTAMPYRVIALVCLLLWALAGYWLCGSLPVGQMSAVSHGPAFLVLALLFFQELILGHYWSNIWGLLTQLYYLPVLELAAGITIWSQRLWPVYLTAFLLMYAAFYAGGCWRQRRQKDQALAKNR